LNERFSNAIIPTDYNRYDKESLMERLNTADGRGRFRAAASVAIIALALLAWRAVARPTGNWQMEMVDSGQVGWNTSLELDAAGRPHISYFDYGNSHLKYTHWDGVAWRMETVDSGDQVGRDTSLALDAAGRPHISYYDMFNSHLKYARWDGVAWQTETVDDDGMVGEYTSLALDSAGRPHISYFDYSNGSLKYTRWDGDAWLTETVAEDVWDPSSLAVDANDRPHISYNQNGNLIYIYWDGDDWQLETVVSDGSAGWITSTALDAAGQPRIAFLDWANNDLKYTYRDGDEWQMETVVHQNAETLVDAISLALDANGEPYIAYSEQSLSAHPILKYAHRDEGPWTTETVDDGALGDSTVDTGFFPSLAIDDAGRPHISYNRRTDVSHEDLMYAVGAAEAYTIYLPVAIDSSLP
jgi:hypothetical protein